MSSPIMRKKSREDQNPNGVKENSPGRKPLELKGKTPPSPQKKLSPERAVEKIPQTFCRPVGAGDGG